MTEESALSVLKGIARTLIDSGFVNAGTAAVAERDPDWDEPECTRRHIALLWTDLQRCVTAEVGTALVRKVDDWTGDFTPRIVVAEADEFEFDDDLREDDPYGWLPLGRVHLRETPWDFPPGPASGSWIGWWEPEVASDMDGTSWHVRGVLSAFIIVKGGNLEFAHVAKRRRRAGIARQLVAYAVEHHGLTHATGPFTEGGHALATAMNLPTQPA